MSIKKNLLASLWEENEEDIKPLGTGKKPILTLNKPIGGVTEEGGSVNDSGGSSIEVGTSAGGTDINPSAPDYVSEALKLLTSTTREPYKAGSYVSPYADRLDELIGELLNSSYGGYDSEKDETYKQYKKQYLREADRTQQDVLGQYATLTGGVPSSSAITAASQAGNQMRGALADIIPELSEADYNRYLSGVSEKRGQLSDLLALENLVYGKYSDEENRKLNAWESEGALQNDAISKLLSAIELQDSREDRADAKSDKAYERVITLLAAGVMPSADQLKLAGISSMEATKLMNYLADKDSSDSEGGADGESTYEDASKWLKEQGVTDLSALMDEAQFEGWNQKYGNYASYEEYVYDYALQRLGG